MIKLIISGIIRWGGNVARSGEEIYAYRFLHVNLKDRDCLEDLRGCVKIRINIS
jgi:hypothetical protein